MDMGLSFAVGENWAASWRWRPRLWVPGRRRLLHSGVIPRPRPVELGLHPLANRDGAD